jgi:Uncharacterised nucleotidyltransferase
MAPASQFSPEVDLLLATARVQMTSADRERIQGAIHRGIDWIRTVRLAMRQGTLQLLYRNLQATCPESVDPSILHALRAQFEKQAAYNRRRAEELVAVLRTFRDAGISAIPYKGPVLAQQIYGDLSLRGFGDLDIMVPEKDAMRARALLLDRGYGSTWPSEEELARHIEESHEIAFSDDQKGLRLDLHWRFVNRYTLLPGDPERFLQRFEILFLGGSEVPTLPLEVYLLVLSLHAAKHRWGQLKLICDIAEILGWPGLDWRYVLNEARDLGLKRVLAVSVLMAGNVLGVKAPERLTRGLKIDRAARSLADEAWETLFDETDESWAEEAPFSFQYKIRERLRDRAKIYYCHEFRPRWTPDERDRELIEVPGRLSALYYLLRPMRMVWEKLARGSNANG